MTNDEAAELSQLAKAQIARDDRAAEKGQSLREVRETMLARLAGDEGPYDDDDALMDASNAVVDLVHAGKLDEAEPAARDLLVRYPQVPDGWDRLGMVYEKRGETREAADCYRRVIAFLDENPDYSDPGCVFRPMSATHSDAFRPPVPTDVGHRFRSKSATPELS